MGAFRVSVAIMLLLFGITSGLILGERTKQIEVIKEKSCTSAVMFAMGAALPYNDEFKCLQRAKAAKEILLDLGINSEIRLGMEEVNGTVKGHAWLDVEGVEYWKGNYSWNVPYPAESIERWLK